MLEKFVSYFFKNCKALRMIVCWWRRRSNDNEAEDIGEKENNRSRWSWPEGLERKHWERWAFEGSILVPPSRERGGSSEDVETWASVVAGIWGIPPVMTYIFSLKWELGHLLSERVCVWVRSVGRAVDAWNGSLCDGGYELSPAPAPLGLGTDSQRAGGW